MKHFKKGQTTFWVVFLIVLAMVLVALFITSSERPIGEASEDYDYDESYNYYEDSYENDYVYEDNFDYEDYDYDYDYDDYYYDDYYLDYSDDYAEDFIDDFDYCEIFWGEPCKEGFECVPVAEDPPYKCVPIDDDGCLVWGCEDGYVENEDGDCVLEGDKCDDPPPICCQAETPSCIECRESARRWQDECGKSICFADRLLNGECPPDYYSDYPLNGRPAEGRCFLDIEIIKELQLEGVCPVL